MSSNTNEIVDPVILTEKDVFVENFTMAYHLVRAYKSSPTMYGLQNANDPIDTSSMRPLDMAYEKVYRPRIVMSKRPPSGLESLTLIMNTQPPPKKQRDLARRSKDVIYNKRR